MRNDRKGSATGDLLGRRGHEQSTEQRTAAQVKLYFLSCVSRAWMKRRSERANSFCGIFRMAGEAGQFGSERSIWAPSQVRLDFVLCIPLFTSGSGCLDPRLLRFSLTGRGIVVDGNQWQFLERAIVWQCGFGRLQAYHYRLEQIDSICCSLLINRQKPFSRLLTL